MSEPNDNMQVIYDIYEKATKTPAQYKRGGRLWETKAFKEWKKITNSRFQSISQIEKYIAKLIADKYHIITFEETDEICLYQNGVFLRDKISKAKIRKKIFNIANNEFSEYQESLGKRGMIIEIIKNMTFYPMEKFGLKGDLINL